jgi:hypothetical protein
MGRESYENKKREGQNGETGVGRGGGELDYVRVAEAGGDVQRRQATLVDFIDVTAPETQCYSLMKDGCCLRETCPPRTRIRLLNRLVHGHRKRGCRRCGAGMPVAHAL